MTRLAALSVDLDEIPEYFDIHGVGRREGEAGEARSSDGPQSDAERAFSGRGDRSQRGSQAPEVTRNLVYDVALERLDALARSLNVPLTLFVIGSDLAREKNAQLLRKLATEGRELGNHTLDHRYDLTRLDEKKRAVGEMRRQVVEGASAIETATGYRPTGFRAPGYTVTDALFDVLTDLGVAYDSSVFPCPPYYLAKASVIAAQRLRGRRSTSIVDTPKVLKAPHRPYRVGRPYWEKGRGLLELPIQVTRGLRLPFIGTTLSLAGPDRARMLTRLVVGEPFVNLELHGIDALDESDGLGVLAPYQPDLRVTWQRKLETLTSVVERLKFEGYSFVTLSEAAAKVAVE